MAINKKLVHFNRKVIYEDKLNNGELMDPNLVFVKNTNEIYALNNGYQFVGWTYLSPTPSCVKCTYHVDSIYERVTLYNKKSSGFAGIYVNNVKMRLTDYMYFDTVGDHVVEIELKDNIIPANAFEGCSNLVSCEINEECVAIEKYAFLNCNNLRSIDIPDTDITVGNYVFRGCSSLPVEDGIRYADSYLVETIDTSKTTYNIKTGTKYIGSYAFKDCSNLSSLIIPDTIMSIGESPFYGCKNLYEIYSEKRIAPVVEKFSFFDLPTGGELHIHENSNYDSWLSSSEYYLGYHEWSINIIERENPELTLNGHDIALLVSPKSISTATKICNNLSGVETMSVDGVATSNGNYVFNSYGDHIVRFKTSTITPNMFKGCFIKKVLIGDRITQISNSAFEDCTSMSSIEFNNITSIGVNSFKNCSRLTSLVLPETLHTIGSNAFENCSRLSEINIPQQVTSIGNDAFVGCTSLPVINDGMYADTYLVKCANKWTSSVTIKPGTRFIGKEAFKGVAYLFTISIPNTVEFIGDSAFDECTYLNNVVLPDNIKYIGEKAFAYCAGINSIDLKNVEFIGMGAFMHTGLTSINIPNTIYDLYDYAFGFCSQLKTVVLPTHSITLHDSVFYNDINIESIENLEYVILEGMSSQFTGVNVNLWCLPIIKCVYDTKASSFKCCNSINSFTMMWLPDRWILPNINVNGNTTSSPTVQFQFKNNSILNNTFSSLPLTTVLIYEPITSIGENAFKDCTMLNDIKCYASVAPSLRTGAFDNISPTGVLKVPAGSDYSSWLANMPSGWTIETF